MIKELFNLKGKTALVTGGGQGIGRAITLALAEYGADVVINYRSHSKLAEQTAADAEKFGVKAHLWQFDLVRADVGKAWGEFSEANGVPADILVANASMQVRAPYDQVTDEDFEAQINVNLRSTLRLIKEVVPHMSKNHWGRILNIGSVQQARPHKDMCVYAASKAGLVNLVKNLAPRLAPMGITINNLAPGAIATARNVDALAAADYKKAVESNIPLGYVGAAEDCAAPALLLCSDAGRYITGADFFVDGGLSLRF